jgi:hypothetical protein
VPSREVVAASDSMDALMRARFPDWRAGRPVVAALSPPEAQSREGSGPDRMLASPAGVAIIDDDHRVLVVTGPFSDEAGNKYDGHAGGGNVGAYAFARRAGRWVELAETPSVTATGFFGDAGKVSIVSLGPGHPAAFVENGSCWQGACGDYLTMIELTTAGGRTLGDAVTLSSETVRSNSCIDADEAGEATPAGAPAASAQEAVDKPGGAASAPDDTPDCFEVTGTWRTQPGPAGGWRDVVITFDGDDPLAAQETGSKDSHLHQVAVLRHVGDGYALVEGRLAARGF